MLSLFFVDNLPTEVGQVYEFDNEDAAHAVRVSAYRKLVKSSTSLMEQDTGLEFKLLQPAKSLHR
jgi:hypothetical protein